LSEPEHEARLGDSALGLGSFLVRRYFRHAEFDRRDAEQTGPLRVVAVCTASSARSMRVRCGCVQRPGRLLSPEDRPGPRDAPGWARCRRAADPPRTGPCRNAPPGSFRQTGPTSKGSLNPATHFAVFRVARAPSPTQKVGGYCAERSFTDTAAPVTRATTRFRLAQEGGNGRYWVRTSDLLLVRLLKEGTDRDQPAPFRLAGCVGGLRFPGLSGHH
jgi:hypothetical protein